MLGGDRPAKATPSLELLGAGEIVARMERLGQTVNRQIAATSLRAGAKIIQAAAARNAPVGHYFYPSQAAKRKPGTLKRSIKVRAGKRTKDSVGIVVGSGKKWFTGDEFYAAFVEFGFKTGKRGSKSTISTSAGDTRKLATGKNRVQVAGEHFIEHSYLETRASALAKIKRTFYTELEIAAARK